MEHSKIEKSNRLRVCAYVRVSSTKEAQLESLENQEAYFTRKYEENADYEFVGVFSDVGITGTNEDRPAFQAMIKKCREGGIDLVHTKSISRFARNTVTVLGISRELKQLGIGIYFEEQNINTLSTEGELMLTVLASFAQAESFDMSENQRWAIKKKFQRGELIVNTKRFLGYDKDEQGSLIVNEKEADIVRLIYEMYLNGTGMHRIAKELNVLGIPTITGSKWNECTIRGMLKNEKYKGDCHLQKYYTPKIRKSTVLNTGKEQSYYITENHEPIISQEEWEKVQSIMSERAKTKRIEQTDTKKYANRHGLTGKMKCPHCGKNLRRLNAYKKCVWACTTYINQGKQACKGIRIPEDIAEKWDLKEPVEVQEVKLNGKKNYSYSGQRKSERRECIE